MKGLIIGKGEVGQGLYEIVKEFHETHIRDIQDMVVDDVKILHICYPNVENFIDETRNYIMQYKPRLTVIHSSISPGLTNLIGPHVIYSPVRGRHPNLAKEMRRYPKFIAGHNVDDVQIAANYFKACKWPLVLTSEVMGTEVLKLLSNIHMGLEIAWAQEVDRILKSFQCSQDLYQEWERTYNKGYKELFQENLIRPIMKPDPIGGHCILECTDILRKQIKSEPLEFIVNSNTKAWQEQEDSNGKKEKARG